MDPKITSKDAAEFLGVSARQVFKQLVETELPYTRVGGQVHFGYPTTRQLFRLQTKPRAISFQIVKGGTGKTSLACAVAVRANLYGLRVLCIDLDQQGNLTNSFGVDAEALPVMVDILAEGYSFEDAITRVYPGMDILSSRIENALLDEVIKIKRLKLDTVYRQPLQQLKEKYDLIVIDCPPNLGQSVAAVTLGVDQVVAPVILENYALSGLRATSNAVKELEQKFNTHIDLGIVVNKYDPKALMAREALHLLNADPEYRSKLFKTYVHASGDFPNAVARRESIFDQIKPSVAKREIDLLTREIIGLDRRSVPDQRVLDFAQAAEDNFA